MNKVSLKQSVKLQRHQLTCVCAESFRQWAAALRSRCSFLLTCIWPVVIELCKILWFWGQ